MNDFYNTQLFLDPYAVEGEERAKRFAKNFNAQERLGIPEFWRDGPFYGRQNATCPPST